MGGCSETNFPTDLTYLSLLGYFCPVEKREALRVRAKELLASWPQESRLVIPALQTMQAHFGYVPPEAVEEVARHLRVSLSRVYGVATFYAQFALRPRGTHVIRVCLGTACHVRGAPRVLDELLRWAKADDREPAQGRLEVEPVRCLGACALAPVVVTADGTYHGGMTPAKARALVQKILRGQNA
jgi:NADH-quinone oxidoreductase subunit E